MRCAINFDEEKTLLSQNVEAWGEMQSLQEEPSYKETDIQNDANKNFFEGYKMALDDFSNALENLSGDGTMSDEAAKVAMQWMYGQLCMVLFEILDSELEDFE